jgi:predicted transcriptional regulator
MTRRTKNMTHKATFTLDEATIRALQEASAATGKSQSLVVREAVAQYGSRPDKMSPAERRYKLKVFREFRKTGPLMSRAEADAEIEEIRRARHEDRRNWL